MTIMINNEQQAFPVDEALLKRAVETTLSLHGGVSDAQVGLTLVDDEAIRQLNQRFRGIDRSTDVLSFPMIDYGDGYEQGADPWEEDEALQLEKDPLTGEVMLGDLVISMPTADRQAQQFGHSPSRELAYLTVHGMLHLLGYDHETAEDKALMRALEEKILLALGLPRTALVTEGALAELTCGADDAAAPQGAAVLGEDGTLYVAAGPDGSAALAGALAKLPPTVGPLACACTAMPASPPPCPLYCRRDGGWYLPS